MPCEDLLKQPIPRAQKGCALDRYITGQPERFLLIN